MTMPSIRPLRQASESQLPGAGLTARRINDQPLQENLHESKSEATGRGGGKAGITGLRFCFSDIIWFSASATSVENSLFCVPCHLEMSSSRTF